MIMENQFKLGRIVKHDSRSLSFAFDTKLFAHDPKDAFRPEKHDYINGFSDSQVG